MQRKGIRISKQILDTAIKKFQQNPDNFNYKYFEEVRQLVSPIIVKDPNYIYQLRKMSDHHLNRFLQQTKITQITQTAYFFRLINFHRKKYFDFLIDTFENQTVSLNLQKIVKLYLALLDLRIDCPSFLAKIRQKGIQACEIHFKNIEPYKNPNQIQANLTQTNLHFQFLMYMHFDVQATEIERASLLKLIQNQYFTKCFREPKQKNKFILKLLRAMQFVSLLSTPISDSFKQFVNTLKHERNFQIEKYNRDKQKTNKFELKAQNTFSSTFQHIFSNYLLTKGYDVKQNQLIGQFEYDFIIKGTYKQEYRPFQILNRFKQQIKSSLIAESYQNQINKMEIIDKNGWIRKQKKFPDSMVLNINGPAHFIDSDTHKAETVTLHQINKYKLLGTYGYKKYNILNSTTWQKINNFPLKRDLFIRSMFENPLLIKDL